MRRVFICAVLIGVACHHSSPVNDPPVGVSTTPERGVAARLGLPPRLAIGLGNDAEGYDPNKASAFTLGPHLDIHYLYLSGLDWPDWNKPEGRYVAMNAEAAKARGVVPMFTLYQGAARGEANLGAFDDDAFMTRYWRGVRIMFARLGESNVPTIVHLEPDLWGYAQQHSEDPAATPMKVGGLVPECRDLPADVSGFGRCIVRLGRRLAPKAVIGLSASAWAAYTREGEQDPERVATYLSKVGGAGADVTIVETLDRDAGCFEAAVDPQCQRVGAFYWDDAAFKKHLEWAKTIRRMTGKPLLWWQTPLGVPSDQPGGLPGHYRDNRVRYVFSHAWEFAQAGGIGVAFGMGKANQTTVRTDEGQFREALERYLASGGNRLN